jgi:hypothetical protein
VLAPPPSNVASICPEIMLDSVLVSAVGLAGGHLHAGYLLFDQRVVGRLEETAYWAESLRNSGADDILAADCLATSSIACSNPRLKASGMVLPLKP